MQRYCNTLQKLYYRLWSLNGCHVYELLNFASSDMHGCYSVMYRFVLSLVVCELDMSNWQQGYDWVKILVFLEANVKMAQAHSFAQLAISPQHSAEFEKTWCVVPVNGNIYHASFIIQVE